MTGELDVEAVLQRRDEVVHDLDDSVQVPWLEQRGVTLVRGHGRLAGVRQVDVDGRALAAKRAVVLATGSEAALPPIPGLAESQPWSNREATTAKRVPDRLIVLGGGVVGVELGQAWVLARLQGDDHRSASRACSAARSRSPEEQVHAALAERGVDLRLGVPAVEVVRNGSVSVRLESGDEITGDDLLVAVGRRPATRELGLETVGLEPGRYVEVDDRLRVAGSDWLYAIGDVNRRALLTHMGKYQARIAADVILGRDARIDGSASGALSPRVVFTDPQVAAVGHTLESALAAGIPARAVDHDTSGVAGGSFYGRGAPGTSRLVVDESRRVLVGATFTGPDVAEFVHTATVAIVGGVTIDQLWHATPSFPTRSEVWLRLLETTVSRVTRVGAERDRLEERAHGRAPWRRSGRT